MRELYIMLVSLICSLSVFSQKVTDYVDPFIGTGGLGHTFPGATLPFGMVQISPSNDCTEWKRCSGYHFSDDVIKGFAHNHISGAGLSGLGDILLMPVNGDISLQKGVYSNDFSSHFSHDKENASPGYYSVILSDNHVKVELTSSWRSGIHRYTALNDDNLSVIIDPTHRLMEELDSVSLTYHDLYTVSGCKFVKNSSAGKRTSYFVARFSHPIVDVDIQDNKGTITKLSHDYGASECIASVNFGHFRKNQKLQVKVALSYTSLENAFSNFSEIEHDDFDKVHSKALKIWNEKLNSIRVNTDDLKDKKIFYTALYHSFISPNLISDVDNSYVVDENVYSSNVPQYSNFSTWDTYRALHPLLLLIDQPSTVGFVNSLVSRYSDLHKTLPVWECLGYDNICMIGYNTVPVIADAILSDLDGINIEEAYQAMKNAAQDEAKHSPNYDMNGMSDYKVLSFVPGEIGCAVSKTVEYNYYDWMISQVALKLKKYDDYEFFKHRSLGYRNLFDAQSHLLLPVSDTGQKIDIDTNDWNDLRKNYVSGNLWGYSTYVPHDVGYLVRMHGGEQDFSKFLDKMFTVQNSLSGAQHVDISGFIGRYAHGDEPSHHVPYLYAFTRQPWKTQEKVAQILRMFYTDTPEGLVNNDDLGQLSAWYIFSSLGFYPVCPGSQQYILGTPKFSRASIKVGRHNFVVTAKNVSSENIYIKCAYLNGREYTKNYITYQDLYHGGKLELVMDSVPNLSRGINDSDLPSGIAQELLPLPHAKRCFTPFLDDDKQVFSREKVLTFKCLTAGSSIFYTLDGSEPNEQSHLYTRPVSITSSCIVKAIAIPKDGTIMPSNVFSREFQKSLVMDCEYPKVKMIGLPSNYGEPDGSELVDGKFAGLSFSRGGWTGFCGKDKDLDLLIDLGKEYDVSTLSFGYLVNTDSWIFPPNKVVLYGGATSDDLHELRVDNDFSKMDKAVRVLENNRKHVKFPKQRLRYLHVIINNFGSIPAWHSGKGTIPYLFVDEIYIN